MCAAAIKAPTPSLFEDLSSRGLIKQVTDPSLWSKLDAGPVTLYCGFDPTADSLHVGSLLPLSMLARFRRAGHRVIAVLGGATGMIGDPSFKAQERALLDHATLTRNLESIRHQIRSFFDPSDGPPVMIVNNADWFNQIRILEFLRDIGKHFTINHMLAKESVRGRLEDREHGISYTEFSYLLLQAYDFFHLNLKHGCQFQIGGSDQWGNITAGGELIRRIAAAEGREAPEVFGLTHPLIEKSGGGKFGKTETGTIWIDAKKTSPFRFYQYFLNTADADVVGLLKYFSPDSLENIKAAEHSTQIAPEQRLAQRKLAREMTLMIHGSRALEGAERATEALFGGSLKDLDEALLRDVFEDAPSITLPRARLDQDGALLVDLLAESGLCPSKGAAKKDLQAGAVSVNQNKVADPLARILTRDLLPGSVVVLRKGKKNYALVKFS